MALQILIQEAIVLVRLCLNTPLGEISCSGKIFSFRLGKNLLLSPGTKLIPRQNVNVYSTQLRTVGKFRPIIYAVMQRS